MSDPSFKFTNAEQSVVTRTWPDGRIESHSVLAPEYLKWLSDGNTPEPADVPAPVIPQVVSMRQARLALLRAGLLSSINAAIAAQDEAVKIEWEYASEVRRDSASVASLADALSLSSEQLDALFTQAATL